MGGKKERVMVVAIYTIGVVIAFVFIRWRMKVYSWPQDWQNFIALILGTALSWGGFMVALLWSIGAWFENGDAKDNTPFRWF